MSQTVVNDEPGQAYEGKLHIESGSHSVSRLASELLYFGKAMSLVGTGEVEVGGASGGPQAVQLPAAAADITTLLEGVAVADPSLERLSLAGVPAPYGAYPDENAVRVLRRGLIWVVIPAALTDITVGVYIRWQIPGGTAPTDSLGSFEIATTANNQIVAAGMAWRGGALVGSTNFGLLEVNLP